MELNESIEQVKISIDDKKKIIEAIELIIRDKVEKNSKIVICSAGDLVVYLDESGVYKVAGSVDIENSYGALIKTPMKFDVKCVDGNWQIISGGTLNSKWATTMGNYLIGSVIIVLLISLVFFIISTTIKFLK